MEGESCAALIRTRSISMRQVLRPADGVARQELIRKVFVIRAGTIGEGKLRALEGI